MPLRDALANVDPYRPQPPARVLAEQLGLERIVKLASNEGAFGPLPEAVAAYEGTGAELARYPDGGAAPLRAALAELHGVAPEQVVPGNGADELIRLCGAAALDAGDAAVMPWPSFPSYLSAAAVHGAAAVKVPLTDARAVDLDCACSKRVARPRRVGGGCGWCISPTPTTPPARCSTAPTCALSWTTLPDRILCVLDEAYAEYADPEPEGPALLREGRPRLCVLRTFSKVYGLAGLRVGYALASPETANALDRVRPIFNVNQPAQAAAVASLAARDAIGERVAHTREARGRLKETLGSCGLRPVASQANFVYADVPSSNGANLGERLLAEGFIVRALGGFGAPGAIRVTCGTDEENAAFAEALARVVPSE